MLELAFQYHVSEEAKSKKHLLRKLRVTILANLTLLLATYRGNLSIHVFSGKLDPRLVATRWRGDRTRKDAKVDE